MTPRSAATRAKLITVAERLFAERGVEGVSLNEINRAARQRHSNACHYHFGSKNGLIQAILDKHVPWIAARRNALFDEMEVAGEGDSLAAVVRAFVRPVAEKLYDPDGGKEFIRLNAHLLTQHTLAITAPATSPFTVPDADRLTRKLKSAMAALALPEPIQLQRRMMAAIMLFHGLADQSRLAEAGDQVDMGIFIQDLETMILGALIAPPARIEPTSTRNSGRHGRACPGHPRGTTWRLSGIIDAIVATWMPGTSPGMTISAK